MQQGFLLLALAALGASSCAGTNSGQSFSPDLQAKLNQVVDDKMAEFGATIVGSGPADTSNATTVPASTLPPSAGTSLTITVGTDDEPVIKSATLTVDSRILPGTTREAAHRNMVERIGAQVRVIPCGGGRSVVRV